MNMNFETKSGYGGTKRRKFTAGGSSRASALSTRVTRLAKTLKATNPVHMFETPVVGLVDWSSAGGIYDVATGIVQGDTYNQRFGNKIIPKRVNLKFTVVPDSTGTGVVTCRIAVVRATYNLGAASFIGGSISPVANTNILQTYYDEIFVMPPGLTAAPSPGWSKSFNRSIPIKLSHLKFNGAGAAALAAESIFVIWCSNAATGTAAPNMGAGIIEFFYIP